MSDVLCRLHEFWHGSPELSRLTGLIRALERPGVAFIATVDLVSLKLVFMLGGHSVAWLFYTAAQASATDDEDRDTPGPSEVQDAGAEQWFSLLENSRPSETAWHFDKVQNIRLQFLAVEWCHTSMNRE